jgi:hypothetical protein
VEAKEFFKIGGNREKETAGVEDFDNLPETTRL